jgi:ATP-dependent RNA helicase DHX8/PRP22
MLDEAHERTVATDVLFALLKKILRKRSDLKVLISSATLNAEKFSSFFNDAPIFTIPGRPFAVEFMYSKDPEPDYLDAALITVLEVHLTEPAGDILLFLTGQEEIEMACEILQERVKALGPAVPNLLVLPVYSTQPTDMQSSIFEPVPPGSRKVVVATNIAETSVTIDDIRYVVDPGFVKQKAYNPDLGMDSLILSPISQAQANQRAGRAGRTGPGKCFRLYTEAAYHHEMVPSPLPGIQRQSLSASILILKAMGIDDILHFDFMDRPAVNTILTALKELYALGALDDEGLLTRLGRRMATFPVEPQLAKVLIAAADLGCSDEMVSIIAMLSAPNIFDRSKETRDQADEKKAAFHDPSGDHLTMLNVYNAWQQSGYSKAWCRENFIHSRFMSRALDVRKQLVQILERQHHRIVSCGSQTDQVRRALCTGFFRNVARMESSDDGPRVFKTLLSNAPVWVHPSSALLGGHAEWVIYHELVLTSREYMLWTTRVEPQWLVEGAPKFLKISDATAKHRDQRGIKPLLKKHESDSDWRLSRQRRVDGHGGYGGRTWG